jgi:hypothetical protein
MQTRDAYRESEIEARRRLVKVAAEMLEGHISFLEGSTIIRGLENSIGGVIFQDKDFIVFDLIVDETDHLPLPKQQPLWQPEALERIKSEIKEKEEKARTEATQACKNLIQRFKV